MVDPAEKELVILKILEKDPRTAGELQQWREVSDLFRPAELLDMLHQLRVGGFITANETGAFVITPQGKNRISKGDRATGKPHW